MTASPVVNICEEQTTARAGWHVCIGRASQTKTVVREQLNRVEAEQLATSIRGALADAYHHGREDADALRSFLYQ
jgi:hypothetical protein